MGSATNKAAKRTFPKQGEVVVLTVTATAQVFDLAATGRFTISSLGGEYFVFDTSTADVYCNVLDSASGTHVTTAGTTADAAYRIQADNPEEFLLSERSDEINRYLYAKTSSGTTLLRIAIVSSD